MPRSCSNCHSSIPIPDDARFCPSCGARADVVAEPVQGATTVMPTVVDPTVTQLDAPRIIAGRFVVSGPVNETPLGSILSANDSQGGAPVRVTLVSTAALPSTALADRALREWKQLGKVTTPKIVRVLDQGKLDDGKVYVASDVPLGRTLEEVVASEGPLPIERIKAIVAQVGEALTEAQKVGVIHRDVSPRNIHVDGDNVTVGEFGLAEAVNDKVFGTPAFLSPEQAEGKPVDQRSNIYSLGALVYYMLTARPPFEGTPESLLAQHVSGVPTSPSATRRSVPPELERIVMKALEKSGGRRHLTLRQLITEVEAVPIGESVVQAADVGSAATLPPAQPAPRPAAATMMGIPAILGSAMDDIKTVEQEKLPEKPVVETPVFVDASSAGAASPRVDHGDVPVFVDQKPTAPEKPQPIVEAVKPVEPVKPIVEPAKTIVEPVKAVELPRPAEPVKAAELPKPEPRPEPAAKPEVKAVEPAKPVAAKQPAAAAAKKGGFRETAWFKKGELDEALAEKQATASDDPLAPTGTTGEHAALDPDSLSAQDERRLSLKTGATQMMPAIKGGTAGSPVIPGERMDEDEMLAEIDRGRRWLTIAAVVLGAAIVVTILVFAVRGGPKSEPAPVAPTAAAPPPLTAPPTQMPQALPPPAQPTVMPPTAVAPVPVAEPVKPATSTPPPPLVAPPAKHGKKRR